MLENGQTSRLTAPKQVVTSENNPKSIFEVFAGRMKMMRKQKGFTQQSLADNIHVSVDTIKRYENGKYEGIDLVSVERIANALGVPVYTLLKEPEQPSEIEQRLLDIDVAVHAALDCIAC